MIEKGTIQRLKEILEFQKSKNLKKKDVSEKKIRKMRKLISKVQSLPNRSSRDGKMKKKK